MGTELAHNVPCYREQPQERSRFLMPERGPLLKDSGPLSVLSYGNASRREAKARGNILPPCRARGRDGGVGEDVRERLSCGKAGPSLDSRESREGPSPGQTL